MRTLAMTPTTTLVEFKFSNFKNETRTVPFQSMIRSPLTNLTCLYEASVTSSARTWRASRASSADHSALDFAMRPLTHSAAAHDTLPQDSALRDRAAALTRLLSVSEAGTAHASAFCFSENPALSKGVQVHGTPGIP